MSTAVDLVNIRSHSVVTSKVLCFSKLIVTCVKYECRIQSVEPDCFFFFADLLQLYAMCTVYEYWLYACPDCWLNSRWAEVIGKSHRPRSECSQSSLPYSRLNHWVSKDKPVSYGSWSRWCKAVCWKTPGRHQCWWYAPHAVFLVTCTNISAGTFLLEWQICSVAVCDNVPFYSTNRCITVFSSRDFSNCSPCVWNSLPTTLISTCF